VKTKYDIVVIGTGTAATAAAMRCCKAGKQVAVVDSRPFGGTCALRGCDPKKVLVGAAELFDWNRRMGDHGLCADQAQIDWPQLIEFKRSFIERVPKNSEESFAKRGVATFHGRARFAGPTSIEVGEDVLEAANVVVAAGAKPVDLKIPGAELAVTSELFLELEHLPGRVLFIGGGYISFEFAHIAARAGARVTILHRGQRPLERFDPDLVDRLVIRTRDLGVDGIVTGALTAKGRIAVAETRAFVVAAGGLPVTFHRAFEGFRRRRTIARGTSRLPC